jgi:hypothetical protein
MADTSLWPVVVGGLLGVGGTLVGVIGTTIRDVAQQRHDKAKRRADKFEELVAAVYEFDHWLNGIRNRCLDGIGNGPETVSPFAKVQSISSVYFPQFDESIAELDRTSNDYKGWIYVAGAQRVSENLIIGPDEYSAATMPYIRKREALLNVLKKFAHDEFQ